MKTKLLYQSENNINIAAELLKNGEIVAFPTETVYGLGACIFFEDAVKKIFAAKGRPTDNPLIAHISDKAQLNQIAIQIPMNRFSPLAENFWPGPLTIVVPKNTHVPDIVSAGLPTIAVRMPNHTIAQKLIKTVGIPLVAPSANVSGKPSPTTVQHVLDDLDGKIAAVIDGGHCSVGIESTVIDITQPVPIILRPGAITREQIENILHTAITVYDQEKHGTIVNSPGLKHKHYAPTAKVFIVSTIEELLTLLNESAEPTLVLANNLTMKLKEISVHPLKMETLYDEFRHSERSGIQSIILFPDSDTLKNEGLMNRIRRAAE